MIYHDYQAGFAHVTPSWYIMRQKDYTPEIITAISQILSVNLSRFNVGTGLGQKREWEVGNKSNTKSAAAE